MDERGGRWSRVRTRENGLDGLLGLVLVTPVLVDSTSGSAGARVATAVVVLVGVASSRTVPLLCLLAAAGLSLPPLAAGFGALSVWPVAAMAVLGCLAGRRGVGLGSAVSVFAAVAAAGLLLAITAGQAWSWLLMLIVEAAAVLTWWLGRSLRLRAQLAGAGWERAQRLDGEHRVAAERARLLERARIARDMHDSLGHRLSLIALQAGALELTGDLTASSRSAAAQLRGTAVDATDLLSEVIGLLRDDAEPTPAQHSGERIADLVLRVREAGAAVTLQHDGELLEMPPRLDRAAYRVVQEALTNALKHAPGAPITVCLKQSSDEVLVVVTSPLPPSAADPDGRAGHGLTGLHERVRLAGGTLRAGPHDGTFHVTARLPRALPAGTTPVPDRLDGWPRPADDLQRASHRMRGDLRRAAAVPIALVAALALVLLGARTYTTVSTALDPADVTRAQIGQTRSQLEPRLPSAHMDQTLPVVPEPPVPRGAQCEYYRTTPNPFTLSNELYRLCFQDGRLISTDLLREQP